MKASFAASLAAFCFLAFLATPALAQEASGDGDYVIDSQDPSLAYKKTTEYDFEDDVVEGSFVRPEGEYIDSRRGSRQNSLIKIRENFVPEMLKSAEDI